MKALEIHETQKRELEQFPLLRGYPQACAILARGSSSQLVVVDAGEARMLMDLAVVVHLDAALRCPFFSDDEATYNPAHEEEFDRVQMGVYDDVVGLLRAGFGLPEPYRLATGD